MQWALPGGEWWTAASSTLAVISLAEIGDKSQLVCMTLATKHRPLPVIAGASVAFALLNILATVFGAAAANWLPETVVTLLVAALFLVFGANALRQQDEDHEENPQASTHRSVFITTFLLLFLAEFGDKTQIAVAGMGSTYPASAVWCGATAALIATSLLGVYAGRRLLQHLSLTWLHRISGIFFIILGCSIGLRLL